MRYFNRYSVFGDEPQILTPLIQLDNKSSDKTIVWQKTYRLHNISQDYYGTPFFDWLIMQKNIKNGMDEFEWAEGDTIIIPYPLNPSLDEYIEKYRIWQRLNN